MAQTIETDIAVIGGGSAGLSVAAGAAMLGRPTVLFEKGEMGGDCLNTGCVPSKALLAAGHSAHHWHAAGAFGIDAAAPEVDFTAVNNHVHNVIAGIAPVDSQERFEGLGVTVIREHARFTDPRTLQAGDTTVKARRFVIATGSRPAVPPITGLDKVPYLTNETIFTLTERPRHLVVIGGGPIGMEMAQAHRRLGSRVTVLQRGPILPKDDPELVAIVRRSVLADGVTLEENAEIESVSAAAEDGIAVTFKKNGDTQTITGSHLLIATGRSANVDGLGLEEAGIEYSPRGVTVDSGLKTSNRKVYAVGDVAGGPQFTHVAGYHAGIVIRNALFRLPAKIDYSALPWVTYTAPELAHVGLTEEQVREKYSDLNVVRWSFAENDRARAERQVEGQIKVLIRGNGKPVGASIVGPHAGDLIQSWGLMIAGKLKASTLAGLIVPYPTLSEVNKRAASAFYSPKLFSERTKTLIRWLAKLG